MALGRTWSAVVKNGNQTDTSIAGAKKTTRGSADYRLQTADYSERLAASRSFHQQVTTLLSFRPFLFPESVEIASYNAITPLPAPHKENLDLFYFYYTTFVYL